jgi:hypothetical protein
MITRRTPIMGNGRGEKALFPGLESPAIAHKEPAASARFEAFDVPERDFPGNRSPPRWKFLCRPKQNLRAWRRGAPSSDDRHSPLLSKQQHSGHQNGDGLLLTRSVRILD